MTLRSFNISQYECHRAVISKPFNSLGYVSLRELNPRGIRGDRIRGDPKKKRI